MGGPILNRDCPLPKVPSKEEGVEGTTRQGPHTPEEVAWKLNFQPSQHGVHSMVQVVVQRNIIQKPAWVFACGQSGWEKVMNMKTLTNNAVV
jgi:hypothetical protein